MDDLTRKAIFDYIWERADQVGYMGLEASESGRFQSELEADPELRRIARTQLDRKYIKDTVLNQYAKSKRYITREDLVGAIQGLKIESIIGDDGALENDVFIINQEESGVYSVPATAVSYKNWGTAVQRLAKFDSKIRLVVLTCGTVSQPQKSINEILQQVELFGFVCCVVRPLSKSIKISDLVVEINRPGNTIYPGENRITKPFLILAGISGTGKTRWVKEMARRTRGELKGDNLCLIPVRPDWHDPTELLGYVSRVAGARFIGSDFLKFLIQAWVDAWKADKTLETQRAFITAMNPFWLVLDEMNLAPVEQYFADYLSVMELRSWAGGVYKCPPLLKFGENADLIKLSFPDVPENLWQAFLEVGGIPLPPNLIVVGTVNMDETTHAFSRKVLDRAMTIEFDEIDLDEAMSGTVEESSPLGPDSVICPFTDATEIGVKDRVKSGVLDLLKAWNVAMADTPFRVAYRTANEGLILAHFKGEEKLAESLDEILMMKLLPRLEGDAEKLGCDDEQKSSGPEDQAFPSGARSTLLESVWTLAKSNLGDHWESSKSKRKLHYMAKRLSRSGYTSFWP